MKKRAFIAGAAAVLLLGAVCLAGCGSGGNYSETFEGVLSEYAYTTELNAAKAFVENEIAGETTVATNVTYTKSGDLTPEEVAVLNLGSFSAEDVTAAEVGVVTYSADTPTLSTNINAKNKSAELYILRIDDAFRYYTPQPGLGEMISKSYFDSVRDPSNYANCTATLKNTIKMTVSGGGVKMTMSADTTVNLKLTATAVELKITMKVQIPFSPAETEVMNAYVLPAAGGGLMMYYNEGGAWRSERVYDYDSLAEFYAYNMNTDFDHSYFEKTKTGFKLSADKYEEYMSSVIENNEELAEMFDAFNTTFSGEATYFVTEGRLSKETMKITLSMSMVEEGTRFTVKADVSTSATYSDFGTTVVNVPSDVR